MNIFQFWVIDSIVKASVSAGILLDSSEDGEEREPIFNAEDSDDEEEHLPKPPARPVSKREHSYPPSIGNEPQLRPVSPVPGAVAPPPFVQNDPDSRES